MRYASEYSIYLFAVETLVRGASTQLNNYRTVGNFLKRLRNCEIILFHVIRVVKSFHAHGTANTQHRYAFFFGRFLAYRKSQFFIDIKSRRTDYGELLAWESERDELVLYQF